MLNVKSYANKAADLPMEPHAFSLEDPKSNEVAIKIKFCGICHSDIHTARSEWGPTFYPCVPGHEIVGEVIKVGGDVKRFKVGQTVGVGCMVGSCQSCSPCEESLEQYCENETVYTYNSPVDQGKSYTKGGYADHVVVDQKFVLNMPKNLDLAAAAPLLCAGITVYSPMKYMGVKSGDKVGVLGLGGLGHMAVKIAKSFGCEVAVFSRSPHKKDDAMRLGADHFILTNVEDECSKFVGQFDYVIDTVSAKHNLDQAFSFLKREGTLAMVGASEKPLEVLPFSLVFQRKKMIGSLIGGIKETQEMLDHCGKHGITSDIEMIQPEEINKAYERVLASDVKYRFVMDCSKI